MNVARYEEPHPQQQVLPNDVIEKAIRLHQILSSQLRPNLSNVARATGMVFFYRFYEHEQNIFPKEFALYAISCLHLATKVCECAIPITTFSSIISGAAGDLRSQFQEVFEILDGIPSFRSDGFIVELNEKLINREMRAIVALEFNFEVIQPYDYILPYIDKILKWHLKPNSEFFQPLKNELIKYCSLFLNDLQLTYMFYIYEPEVLAIAAINMTFKWIKLPLISPSGNPWYNFLVPNLKNDVYKVIDAVLMFFSDQFQKQKKPLFSERRTKVPDEYLETWLNYPYMPMKDVPLCPPPPIQMADQLVEDSNSFKHCELDHVPQYQPPPYLMPKTNSPILSTNPNLQQFHKELQPEIPNANSKKKQKSNIDDRKPKKGKNIPSDSLSRHGQRLHGDHSRGNRDDFPPPRIPISPPKRGNLRHHRRELRRAPQEYNSDYEYDYDYQLRQLPPFGPISGPQNDRRPPRWRPREGQNNGSQGGGGWSPPQRGRGEIHDGYYPYDSYDEREMRRGQSFTSPITPSPPIKNRSRERDRDKERDKNYYDEPRFFRGPPPGRPFRDPERGRDRKGGRNMIHEEQDRERGRLNDKERERKNDRNIARGEDERERNRERLIDRERGREKQKEKETERNRDRNGFNGKGRTDDSKDTGSQNKS